MKSTAQRMQEEKIKKAKEALAKQEKEIAIRVQIIEKQEAKGIKTPLGGAGSVDDPINKKALALVEQNKKAAADKKAAEEKAQKEAEEKAQDAAQKLAAEQQKLRQAQEEILQKAVKTTVAGSDSYQKAIDNIRQEKAKIEKEAAQKLAEAQTAYEKEVGEKSKDDKTRNAAEENLNKQKQYIEKEKIVKLVTLQNESDFQKKLKEAEENLSKARDEEIEKALHLNITKALFNNSLIKLINPDFNLSTDMASEPYSFTKHAQISNDLQNAYLQKIIPELNKLKEQIKGNPHLKYIYDQLNNLTYVDMMVTEAVDLKQMSTADIAKQNAKIENQIALIEYSLQKLGFATKGKSQIYEGIFNSLQHNTTIALTKYYPSLSDAEKEKIDLSNFITKKLAPLKQFDIFLQAQSYLENLQTQLTNGNTQYKNSLQDSDFNELLKQYEAQNKTSQWSESEFKQRVAQNNQLVKIKDTAATKIQTSKDQSFTPEELSYIKLKIDLAKSIYGLEDKDFGNTPTEKMAKLKEIEQLSDSKNQDLENALKLIGIEYDQKIPKGEIGVKLYYESLKAIEKAQKALPSLKEEVTTFSTMPKFSNQIESVVKELFTYSLNSAIQNKGDKGEIINRTYDQNTTQQLVKPILLTMEKDIKAQSNAILKDIDKTLNTKLGTIQEQKITAIDKLKAIKDLQDTFQYVKESLSNYTLPFSSMKDIKLPLSEGLDRTKDIIKNVVTNYLPDAKDLIQFIRNATNSVDKLRTDSTPYEQMRHYIHSKQNSINEILLKIFKIEIPEKIEDLNEDAKEKLLLTSRSVSYLLVKDWTETEQALVVEACGRFEGDTDKIGSFLQQLKRESITKDNLNTIMQKVSPLELDRSMFSFPSDALSSSDEEKKLSAQNENSNPLLDNSNLNIQEQIKEGQEDQALMGNDVYAQPEGGGN